MTLFDTNERTKLAMEAMRAAHQPVLHTQYKFDSRIMEEMQVSIWRNEVIRNLVDNVNEWLQCKFNGKRFEPMQSKLDGVSVLSYEHQHIGLQTEADMPTFVFTLSAGWLVEQKPELRNTLSRLKVELEECACGNHLRALDFVDDVKCVLAGTTIRFTIQTK